MKTCEGLLSLMENNIDALAEEIYNDVKSWREIYDGLQKSPFNMPLLPDITTLIPFDPSVVSVDKLNTMKAEAIEQSVEQTSGLTNVVNQLSWLF